VFRGSFVHLIDAKGRVSIPARYREVVVSSGRSELVVTRCPNSPPSRLEAYPVGVWEKLDEQLQNRAGRFDPDMMRFEDFFVGNAQSCEIDSQGRILIPTALREWAGLEKEVVFSGARDRFRIWTRESWEQEQQVAALKIQSGELLSKLNL
jgi:MraZ protein